MKKKIILIGAGGHAKSCINILEKSKKFPKRLVEYLSLRYYGEEVPLVFCKKMIWSMKLMVLPLAEMEL
jgi:hypothetical protein